MKLLSREQIAKLHEVLNEQVINEKAVDWEDSIAKSLVSTALAPFMWTGRRIKKGIKRRQIKVMIMQWGAEYVNAIRKAVSDLELEEGEKEKGSSLSKKVKDFFKLNKKDKENIDITEEDINKINNKELFSNDDTEERINNIKDDEAKRNKISSQIKELNSTLDNINNKYTPLFKELDEKYNLGIINEEKIEDEEDIQLINMSLIGDFVNDINKILPISQELLSELGVEEEYLRISNTLDFIKQINIDDTTEIVSLYSQYKYIMALFGNIKAIFNDFYSEKETEEEEETEVVEGEIEELKGIDINQDSKYIDLINILVEGITEITEVRNEIESNIERIRNNRAVSIKKFSSIHVRIILENFKKIKGKMESLVKNVNIKPIYTNITKLMEVLNSGYSDETMNEFYETTKKLTTEYVKLINFLNTGDDNKFSLLHNMDPKNIESLKNKITRLSEIEESIVSKPEKIYDFIQNVLYDDSLKLREILDDFMEIKALNKVNDNTIQLIDKLYQLFESMKNMNEEDLKKANEKLYNMYDQLIKNLKHIYQTITKNNKQEEIKESYIITEAKKFKLPKNITELFPKEQMEIVKKEPNIKNRTSKTINYVTLNTIMYNAKYLIENVDTEKDKGKEQKKLQHMFNNGILNLNNYFQHVINIDEVMNKATGNVSQAVQDNIKNNQDTFEMLSKLNIDEEMTDSTHTEDSVYAYHCEIDNRSRVLFMSPVRNNDYVVKQGSKKLYLMQNFGAYQYDKKNKIITQVNPFKSENIKYLGFTALKPSSKKYGVILFYEKNGEIKLIDKKQLIEPENYNGEINKDIELTVGNMPNTMSSQVKVLNRYIVDPKEIDNGTYPEMNSQTIKKDNNEINDLITKTRQLLQKLDRRV